MRIVHSTILPTATRSILAAVSFAALAVAAPITSPVYAETVRFAHCLAGCPAGSAEQNPIIARSIYTLSFNPDKGIADWVAYIVTAESIGVATNLSRTAVPDPHVVGTLDPDDFVPAGEPNSLVLDYFAPLVSFAGTPYWAETNYLSNRVPRNGGLNRGSWYGLEWAVRNLANRTAGLYVVTGPLYGAMQTTIVESDDSVVPSGFFKVVADGNGSIAAFLFPQDLPFHIHHCNQQVSLDEIERLSGLDLFPELTMPPVGDLGESLGCFR